MTLLHKGKAIRREVWDRYSRIRAPLLGVPSHREPVDLSRLTPVLRPVSVN